MSDAKKSRGGWVLLGVSLGGIGLIVVASLSAAATPVGVGLEMARHTSGLPALGVELESFTVVCDTNPDGGVDLIKPSSGDDGYASIYCENTGSTPVYYGGATTTTESTAPSICNGASCVRSSFSMDVRRGLLGCDSSSGSVTLRCLSGR